MSKSFPLFILLALLVSCAPLRKEHFNNLPFTHEVAEQSEAILVLASKMHYEKNLFLEHSCQVLYPDGKRVINFLFTSQDILDMEEARERLVDLVDAYTGALNLSPFDFDLEIRFDSFYVKFVDAMKVHRVFLRDGIATFYAMDNEDCDTDCHHMLTETFVQSQTFVKAIRKGEALYKPLPPELKPSAFVGERFLG